MGTVRLDVITQSHYDEQNNGILCATYGKFTLCITVLLHLVCIIQHSEVRWNTVPNESA